MLALYELLLMPDFTKNILAEVEQHSIKNRIKYHADICILGMDYASNASDSLLQEAAIQVKVLLKDIASCDSAASRHVCIDRLREYLSDVEVMCDTTPVTYDMITDALTNRTHPIANPVLRPTVGWVEALIRKHIEFVQTRTAVYGELITINMDNLTTVVMREALNHIVTSGYSSELKSLDITYDINQGKVKYMNTWITLPKVDGSD